MPTTETILNSEKKRWYRHLLSSITPPWSLFASGFGVFVTFWTIIEATAFFDEQSGNRIQQWDFYLYLATISLLIGYGLVFWKYWRGCPSPAERFPRTAQVVSRRQQLGWEYQLAQLFFVHRIVPLNAYLNDLFEGTAFVAQVVCETQDEFCEHASLHFRNLEKMGITAKRVFSVFLRAFEGKISADERIRQSDEAVAKIERLYRDTIEFEVGLRKIAPQDGFERLHELQLGWSQPIRDAFQELLIFLQKARDAFATEEENLEISHKVELQPPDSLDEFTKELARLS